MSARRLSAAGLAALKRAVNDSATVERFRSKAVQVPGVSACGGLARSVGAGMAGSLQASSQGLDEAAID